MRWAMTSAVRCASAHQLVERALDGRLRLGIHRRRAVIQDEQARVGEQGPRDRQALALASRQAHAALAHHRVVALGQLGDEPRRLCRLGRRVDLLLGGVRTAIRDVLAHRAREEHRVLEHHAQLRAQARERHVAHVLAIEQHRARRHVVEARHQVDDRALARARRAEDRHQLPRLGHEVHPAQDLPLAARVAEAHAAKLHPALEPGQGRGAGLVGHLHLGVEQLEDALGGGPRPGDLRRDEAQRHDRHEQEAQVAVERHQLPQSQRVAEDERPAHAHHHERAQVGEEAHQGEVVGHRVDDAQIQPQQRRVDALVALRLARLARERAHHAQAAQVLLQHRVELAQGALHLSEQRAHVAHERAEDPHDGGDGRQRRHRQHGVDAHQQHRAAHQHQPRGRELDDPRAHEGAHLLDVVGEPGEQLPRLRLIVIAEAQPLDAREERLAQVEGHAL